MRKNNILDLQEIMQILDQGYYVTNGKRIDLKLSRSQMEKVFVYLPDEVKEICEKKDIPWVEANKKSFERVRYQCVNIDSFSLARECEKDKTDLSVHTKENSILVLNLANSIHPGGGVRRGAKAQEEDLCRKSSLLLSLESEAARSYYDYNWSLRTYMGSDAIIITPDVEIIKDEKGNLLEDSVIVSVMTCAAPNLTNGLEGMSKAEYKTMLYQRITGMLKMAAYLGYKILILGAFGCGAFHNDARIVSNLFYKALKEFCYVGKSAEYFFQRVEFAVLDHTVGQYNFREFSRNFNHFYEEKNQWKG